MKLWQGRLSGETPADLDALNNSIRFDQRLYPQDIRGSIAHARMLGEQGIIAADEADKIVSGLESILEDLDNDRLFFDMQVEDIHTFIEGELIRRVGDVGKKLHTGRSRNDQVATDLRLYLRDEIGEIRDLLNTLGKTLAAKAHDCREMVMPGYTHLQRAQPITFGHHLNAYRDMLARDDDRLADCARRLNRSPLGAGALAGSTFPLDRKTVAYKLGFDDVIGNSLDAVADRDFAAEFLGDAAILMMHLSRLCEEITLWASREFGFVKLDDAWSTGSSMMPQKKNPDVAELVRGKTGRVYGSLINLLTVMKGLPLAYNKDLQEDKEAVFDTVDTLKLCLPALTGLIATLKPQPEAMATAVADGFLNATDLADYLVRKGLPFRDAYALVGQIVQHCAEKSLRLEDLPLDDYRRFSPHFDADVLAALDIKHSLKQRGLL